MLTKAELVALAEAHDGHGTLSAYLPVEADTGNPGAAWRTLLRNGVAKVRESLAAAPHDERNAFETCAARLAERADADMHAQGGGTWVGFASGKDFVYDETLPQLLPSLVTWETRPRIVPYLAAIEPQRAIILLMDRMHATIYRANDGELEEIDRVDTEPKGGVGSHMSAPPKPAFHTGTRGTPGADVASRQAIAAFRKHRAAIAERLRHHDREGSWIVVGGASEAVAQTAPALNELAPDRIFVAEGLTMAATPAELRATTHAALMELRARRQSALVEDLLTGNRHPHLHMLDMNAIDEALTLRTVDTIVMSARWIAKHGEAAESLVRRALEQSANIEIAKDRAGEELDAGCGGVAAKLRFSLAQPATEGPGDGPLALGGQGRGRAAPRTPSRRKRAPSTR
jgi:hypothetical protein